MSTEVINNLKSQLKLYQQMFEQLENGNSEVPTVLPTVLPNNIPKPNTRYIKVEDILKLFNFSKLQYNNILVRYI